MEATPKLNAALVKVQKALKPTVKDREGQLGNRKYKYVDLATVMEACKGPLGDCGLAVSQMCSNDAAGVCVVTSIRHESGESLESPCWLPVVEKTPQGYGSAISYARRYGLSAILGMVTEDDDDGAAASTSNRPPPPEGMPALAAKMAQAPARKNGAPKTSHDRTFVMPFANKKNEMLHQLTDKNLAWFQNALEENIDDPQKSRFIDSNKDLLARITAEMYLRGAQANGAPNSEEPPPNDGEDLPF